MRSFEISETKIFMSALLKDSAFDNFAVSEVHLTTSSYWLFDGHRNQAFYEEKELEELKEKDFILWSEVKPQIFNIIKGNRLPLSLKITFRLNTANTANVVRDCGTSIPLEQVGGIFLTVKYDRESLQVVSGTSLKSFSMDRSLDNAWDEYASKFLNKLGVM